MVEQNVREILTENESAVTYWFRFSRFKTKFSGLLFDIIWNCSIQVLKESEETF